MTFGSGPEKSKKSNFQDDITLMGGSDYHIICETGNAQDSHGMRPLDPVRVRSDFIVTTA